MNSKIESLGILRLILVAMIYCCHTGIYPSGGVLAVMYFFVLSGFCTYLGYCSKVDDPGFSYAGYIRRKYARLFPQHWFCTLLIIILFVIQGIKINYPALLANTFLVQSWVPLSEYYFSFNGVAWFLSDICFFLLLSPFLVRLIKRVSNKLMLIICVVLFIAYLVFYLLVPEEKMFYFKVIFPLTRLTDYVMGMALCKFFFLFKERKPQASNALFFIAPAALTAAVLISIFSPTLHSLAPLYLIPVSATIFFLSTPESAFIGKYKITQILFHLSKYTLAFYLVHQVVLKYTVYVFGLIGIDSFLVFAPTTLIISALLSWVMHKFEISSFLHTFVRAEKP